MLSCTYGFELATGQACSTTIERTTSGWEVGRHVSYVSELVRLCNGLTMFALADLYI